MTDLAVGRLVETPEEIIRVVATFISRGGILALSVLDGMTGHKVLVTGYDFLLDSGKTVRQAAMEKGVLPKAELDRLLDPASMTEPKA